MAILRQREVWRSPSSGRGTLCQLTDAEQANVKAALRALRVRLGSWPAVAKATGMSIHTVSRGRTFGIKLAMRAARAAGVEIGDVISGRWPKKGACPMCGHESPLR